MRNKKQYYFYPVYFDANRSRSQGRRVKKKLAVKSPSIQDLAQAATILDVPFELNSEAIYPRFWWIPSGRLQVKKDEAIKNKNALLKKIAMQLRKIHVKK
ncbi:MAG: hypothetical protein HWN66_00790 [Candidatus Helarchaeota archaeon]|nr:hypothetical protein [Candidatus Helarchaeota archaeon]